MSWLARAWLKNHCTGIQKVKKHNKEVEKNETDDKSDR
ncbi:MAG: hypothetical protein RHS_3039 [Robinsoniella sp. RHS]|nr:MAG: hypothetical protein RHS_3039 [Robinsoniella sp. RHS]